MEEVKEDVNNAQVVTETEDANKEQVVVASGENTDSTNQQATEEAVAGQEKTVPYDRFKEVNDQKKAAEEQVAYAQRQIDLMQQNQQAQQTQQVQKSSSQQALDSLGITADDLYGDNIVKYQEAVNQIENSNRQQGQVVMESQNFLMSHPDANQVVGSVNLATGQIMNPSAELLGILAKKPHLAAACTPQGAYDIVMQERKMAEFEKTQTIATEQITRQKVDNATLPLGGSAAGGGSMGAASNTGLMTREQQREIIAKLDAGETIS